MLNQKFFLNQTEFFQKKEYIVRNFKKPLSNQANRVNFKITHQILCCENKADHPRLSSPQQFGSPHF